MPSQKTTRIPGPLYAAAGAGDLAYQKLRNLPGKVAELRGRVVELRPTVTEAVSERQLRADLDRLRAAARRNASAFVSSAQAAQERAVTVYGELVARGERVVRTVRSEAAETVEPSAEIEAAPVEAEADAEGKAVPEKPSATKPAVKRTKPAAK